MTSRRPLPERPDDKNAVGDHDEEKGRTPHQQDRTTRGCGTRSRALLCWALPAFLGSFAATLLIHFFAAGSSIAGGTLPPVHAPLQAAREAAASGGQIDQPQGLPVFGLTTGRHSNENGKNCGKKLKRWCQGYCSKHGSQPPMELLKPGLLGPRQELPNVSQCFLWYTNAIFSRLTGGAEGIQIPRLGPGLDNKAFFIHSLQHYEMQLKCKPNQVWPPTLELNNSANCKAFYHENSRFAPVPNSLWFLKKEKGSTGRHITLTRRHEIEADAARGLDGCPRSGAIASLEVPRIWTINNRKWDNRIYVLVASIQPLVVLFRAGHLRFSVLNHTQDHAPGLFAGGVAGRGGAGGGAWAGAASRPPGGGRGQSFGGAGKGGRAQGAWHADEEISRHVTNPRFGMSFTRDTNDVIKPVDYLREVLVREYGPSEGEARYRRYLKSVRNAAQVVIHAIRDRHWGNNVGWGFLFLAMDVAADLDQNAFVLDLNSGPSFYHKEAWPPWFVRERSSMIRSAFDVIQEVAYRKKTMQDLLAAAAGSNATTSKDKDARGDRGDLEKKRGVVGESLEDLMKRPFETNGEWDVLYREDSKLEPVTPQAEGILPRGACVELQHGAPA